MLLSDVRTWIKGKFECQNFYSGRADTNKDEYLAMYDMPVKDFAGISVGASCLSSYNIKVVKFILRYGKNSDSAEKKARELYNLFVPTFSSEPVTIGGHRVVLFNPASAAPQAMGTDDNGNFEYSLDVSIYYER